MDPTKRELLQRMPIFGGVSEDAIAFLLERANPALVAAGDYFFREGDRGGSAYVLERGSAEVLKDHAGAEFQLMELGDGDCFGEVALFDFGTRSASVRARQPCTALELTAGALHALAAPHLEQFAIVYMNLGREACRRLRAADDRLFIAKVEHADSVVEGYQFRS